MRNFILFLNIIGLFMACNTNQKQSQSDSINNDEEVEMIELGDWEIGEYVNEFKEETGETYIYQKVKGTYNYLNSPDNDLTAKIYVNDNGIYFDIDGPIITTVYDVPFVLKAKDNSGDITEVNLLQKTDGYIYPSTENDVSKLIDLFIAQEENIKFYAEIEDNIRINFTMNPRQMMEALEYKDQF